MVNRDLSLLLKSCFDISFHFEQQTRLLALDSRRVVPQSVFIACSGTGNVHGHAFIQQAIENGASLILKEVDQREHGLIHLHETKKIPVIGIFRLKERLGMFAHHYYGLPSSQLHISAITGTNGKTSNAFLISSACNYLGKPSGFIGTIGVGIPPQPLYQRYGLSTPSVVDMHYCLADFTKKSVESICLEATSHALSQNRLDGVKIDQAVFTNLSHDHLDYHESMEEYINAKKKLFSFPSLKHLVINADDDVGQKIMREYQGSATVLAYGLNPPDADLKCSGFVGIQTFNQTKEGLHLLINSPWGEVELKSPMLGKHNASNLLSSLVVLCNQGIPIKKAAMALSQIEMIPGRLQRFGGDKKCSVFIDFAHTPEALRQVLETLKTDCSGKLWCVFGCGGDRDVSKRSEMGKIAEQLSDVVILTNDNPRHEKPEDIIDDILKGIVATWDVSIELNRSAAIALAINNAQKDDVILIAGKGHESYQIIGDDHVYFSDQDQVKSFLAVRGAYEY